MDSEPEWKAVIGWEGYYEVSGAGQVRRIGKRGHRPVSPIRTPSKLVVSLSRPGFTRSYGVHRLVAQAFLAGGTGMVDHIDGDIANNRISNLRWATMAENLKNQKARKAGQHKGVCLRGGRWRASITHNYKQINLGYFDSEIEAAKAYDAAAVQINGRFARLNFPLSMA